MKLKTILLEILRNQKSRLNEAKKFNLSGYDGQKVQELRRRITDIELGKISKQHYRSSDFYRETIRSKPFSPDELMTSDAGDVTFSCELDIIYFMLPEEGTSHSGFDLYLNDLEDRNETINIGSMNDPESGFNKKKYKFYAIKLPNRLVGSSEGRAGFLTIEGVQVPTIAYWRSYNQFVKPIMEPVKILLNKLFNFPVTDGIILSTSDRIAWDKTIKNVKADPKRSQEMELMKQYHKETDPKKKRMLAIKLGMIPEVPIKQKITRSGD